MNPHPPVTRIRMSSNAAFREGSETTNRLAPTTMPSHQTAQDGRGRPPCGTISAVTLGRPPGTCPESGGDDGRFPDVRSDLSNCIGKLATHGITGLHWESLRDELVDCLPKDTGWPSRPRGRVAKRQESAPSAFTWGNLSI